MIKVDAKQVNVKSFLQTPSVFYQVIPQAENKVGRPTFEGKNENEVVAKLQWAFSIGAKPKEACCYAGISTDSFYRYCRKYPEFRNKIEVLQVKPEFIARIHIYNQIVAGNLKISRWYLERKRPEEFAMNTLMKYRLQKTMSHIEYLERKLYLNNIDFKKMSMYN